MSDKMNYKSHLATVIIKNPSNRMNLHQFKCVLND